MTRDRTEKFVTAAWGAWMWGAGFLCGIAAGMSL